MHFRPLSAVALRRAGIGAGLRAPEEGETPKEQSPGEASQPG